MSRYSRYPNDSDRMYHSDNRGQRRFFDKFINIFLIKRYRGILSQSITHADVYVAINSHYHDYCELFKAWFGDGIDQKIIESAIIFWFKDDDYREGSKLWNYFKEN